MLSCLYTHTHACVTGATLPVGTMSLSQFSSCTNHAFIFCLLMPWPLGNWPLWRDSPSSVSQFLEVVNNSPTRKPFHTSQPTRAIPLTTSLTELSHHHQYLPAPSRHGHYQTARASPYTRELTGIIQTSQAQVSLPALPVPSYGNHKITMFVHSPPLPSPLLGSQLTLVLPQYHALSSWDLWV